MNHLDFARKQRAWERFFATGEIDHEVVLPEVAKSWQRCRDAHLDPHAPKAPVLSTPEELARRLQRNDAFFAAALPVMRFLQSAVRDTGFILVLTDQEGVVLESFGDPAILALAAENNYVPGCCREEAVVGTNAIGLAMIEARPIQLSGAEHYNVRHHRWTCTSAPVFSPAAAFLGTVTLSGQSDNVHPHTLGMVIAAAEAIQNSLREKDTEAERSRSEILTRSLLKSVTDAIVTVDPAGNVVHVNRVAEALLRCGQAKLTARPLSQLFSAPEIDHLLLSRREVAPFEAAYDLDGQRTYFIVKPMIIHDDKDVTGAILTLTLRREFLKNVRGVSGSTARYTLADIVGRDRSILRAIELAEMVARQNSRVLITGETGTGKELLVQGIHNASARAAGPFVALNCAAIPHDLIEAELLGYKEGAFTGARRGGQVGKLELADGGTLFLDEVSQMPFDMQAKLLRVLQDGMVTRLGDTKSARVDVRVIAATNEDLFEKAQDKAFRLDLYFRLSVVEIKLPPLRERGDDIDLLSQVILERLRQRLGRGEIRLSPAAADYLRAYPWPGNIRELENTLEMAAIICETSVIDVHHLSSRVTKCERRPLPPPTAPAEVEPAAGPGIAQMREIEADAIRSALREYDCNISKVSRALGISRSTIYRKMRENGLIREVRLG